jgi:hypothetical protein
MATLWAIHVIWLIFTPFVNISPATAGPTKYMTANRAGVIGILMIVIVGAKLVVHENPLAVSSDELIR